MTGGQVDVAGGLYGPGADSGAPERLVWPLMLGLCIQLIERITVLTTENTDLIARNTVLAERCVEVLADNAALAAENADLGARLARCEHVLSRNSANSSMPPSADDAPGYTPPHPPPVAPRRGGSRRRRGKQPGAAGATLGWTDHPTRRVDRFPQGVCRWCGRDLGAAVDEGIVASHQQHDIAPVEVTVTQYDLHRVRCGCGHIHTAQPAEGTPDGVCNNTVSWGPNTQAVCVFLLSEHHLPVRRVADVIHALAGRSPSTGFIHGLIGRVATRIHQAGIPARIRGALGVAPAVCVDETPIRVGPAQRQPGGLASKKYLHVACTDRFTDYLVGERGLDTITDTVIPALPESVVLVHDRYSAYDSPVLGAHTHQLCVAHLLRNLAAADQAYPGQGWAQQILWSLRGLIHAANTARDRGGDGIDPVCRDRWVRFLRSGVQIGLAHTQHASSSGGGRGDVLGPGQRSTRLLLEVLRDRESDVLVFAHDLRVPATSNQAERDLRPAKLAQKISGRHTSLGHTTNRYVIKGYTSTAAKHGITTFAALRQVIAGRPWMPPSPAPI
ncbi:IS66 family transposase [Mycobacterium sp.]|uniref:IS66 family transposase n=1 Tax=Mycobacterium sp. TaxID=1785 RepID=UPI003BAABA9E